MNSENKKIFVVSGVNLSHQKAQRVHLLEVWSRFSEKGYEIFLFAKSNRNEANDFLVIKRVPFINTEIFKLNRFSYQVMLFISLFIECLRHRPCIFYIRSSGFIDFITSLISRLFHIPMILEVNGIVPDELKSKPNIPQWEILLYTFLEKRKYKWGKKIIVPTPQMKMLLSRQHIPEEKIIVISNGANIDLFRPANPEKSRRELGLNEGDYYVGFVGNLATWHGVEYLIQAAPLVLKELSNTRFLVIGNGILWGKLIKQVRELNLEDKFNFTGYVLHEEIPKYINSSDITVAPFTKKRNKAIGLSPLKIYEYAACEKAIITSRIPNLEVIEEENMGILVEPENPEELAEAIVELLKNKELRTEMGKRGRKVVKEHYSWEKISEEIMKVCETVAN